VEGSGGQVVFAQRLSAAIARLIDLVDSRAVPDEESRVPIEMSIRGPWGAALRSLRSYCGEADNLAAIVSGKGAKKKDVIGVCNSRARNGHGNSRGCSGQGKGLYGFEIARGAEYFEAAVAARPSDVSPLNNEDCRGPRGDIRAWNSTEYICGISPTV